jgi:antigen flippase
VNSHSSNVALPCGAAKGAPPTSAPREQSYGQILKSSALIGGSSFIKIGLGVIRTKAMAVLLGPAGVGLMGLYGSILDLAQNIAGMGLNSSGVRQIAEAVGSGENERIGRTATVLRRIAMFLGLLGAALLVVFCNPISKLTFGTSERAGSVMLLSLAVFFGSIAAGQSALIQGMRRIVDLARMNILGAIFGTISSIGFIYFLREMGIVPALIAVTMMGCLTAWWFSRKIHIQAPSMSWTVVGEEAALLLRLGFAFMASGFLTMGAAYVIRLIIVRRIGIEAAGFYQSSWALGGLYVGFILQAMGADFYPRLTAINQDDAECNRLVNEQATISLLLAGPGVLGTLTFASLVISLFYSSKFSEAVPVLRWICLGMTLRVIAWPMGFIVLAKGAQKIFFWTEVAATVVHVGLAWLFIRPFGLAGAGAAFFGLYVWHGLLIYFIVRRLSGFRWSAINRRTAIIFLPLAGIIFAAFNFLPFWIATALGILGFLVGCVYSIRVLTQLVSLKSAPPWLTRVLRVIPWVSWRG